MSKIFGYRSIVATSTGEIGQLTNITGPGTDAADVDTTTMDSSSNFRTFVSGLIDPGEMTLSVMYDPALASHKTLYRAQQNRTQKVFTVYHGSSTGDTDVFTAGVKSVGREIPMDNMITCDFSLKVTGKPGYTT